MCTWIHFNHWVRLNPSDQSTFHFLGKTPACLNKSTLRFPLNEMTTMLFFKNFRCRNEHSLILLNTYKVYSTKAAMSDLPQIWVELFWVLLEEEICDFGVLQTPRPTAVGHNGELGGDAAAARNYLGLRQRLESPHRWLICRTEVSYVFRAEKLKSKKPEWVHWRKKQQRDIT